MMHSDSPQVLEIETNPEADKPAAAARLDIVIGQAVRRVDGPAKVSGRAIYSDDMHRPRMLHGALLGSAHPHARIVSIDTAQAKALPGVRAVLTGRDIPDQRVGIVTRDQYILAKDKVRFVGEPVAAVAADTLKIARAALKLIRVEYERLPAVFDAEEAMKPDAVQVHEEMKQYETPLKAPRSGNICAHVEVETGNVDANWSECDLIVENVYRVPAMHPLYMEPCSAVAEVDGNGKVTVWASTQSIFAVQSTISRALELPMSKVRVVAPTVGGGFGAKTTPTVEPVTCALALATQRPVKLTLSRDEDLSMMRSRHESKVYIKTGVKNDGSIVCRDVKVVLNGGAYEDYSAWVLVAGVNTAHGPYRIPNLRVIGDVVYTNRLSAGAVRGFGGMQTTFATESQLDEIASKLQIDPFDLRLRNAVKQGDYVLGSHKLESCHYSECLAAILEHPTFIRARSEKFGPTGRRRAIGISGVMQGQGLGTASASVRIAEDGSVVLSTAFVEIGSGSDTTLAQVCAATLGIDVGQVNVAAPDTDGPTYDFGSLADRGSRGVAKSVQLASLAARDKLIEFASLMMKCDTADLTVEPGGMVRQAGGAVLTFSQIVQWGLYKTGGAIIGTHSYHMDGQVIDPKRTRAVGLEKAGSVWYGFGAAAVQIEVDEESGRIGVVNVWYSYDVGKVINPNGAAGQIYGGVLFGLGGALLEEFQWDNGHLLNSTFMDYKIMSSAEAPENIYPLLLEFAVPGAPYGAKGFGEPVVIPIAPAIANALDAGFGIRLRALPLKPEHVLERLMEQELSA